MFSNANPNVHDGWMEIANVHDGWMEIVKLTTCNHAPNQCIFILWMLIFYVP
jgi:hypothetical protein